MLLFRWPQLWQSMFYLYLVGHTVKYHVVAENNKVLSKVYFMVSNSIMISVQLNNLPINVLTKTMLNNELNIYFKTCHSIIYMHNLMHIKLKKTLNCY